MRRRRLNPDEKSLWKDVTRSIAPLRGRRADQEDGEAAATPPPPSPSPSSKHKAKPRGPAASAPVLPTPPRPQPAPLGRKARRRLARGTDPIDGRLDLHGMTQAQAHDALLGFLRRSSGRGARVVLVITGKGGGAGSEGRGVLKRQVPMWLRLAEFREFVVGFEAAGIGHGGEGAMYVRLRR
jgi:DNA-nicking Smr family endonuclease